MFSLEIIAFYRVDFQGVADILIQ